MTESIELTEALNSLKNPKARAEVVVELLAKPSEAQAIEIDGLVGDSLRTGVGVLFQQRDFQRGLAMARKGGILEELITEIRQSPVEPVDSWPMPKEERGYKGIPKVMRDLPGFNYDFEGLDWQDEKRNKIFRWVKDLKRALVEEVLIPDCRYKEAVQQMQQLERMEAEITTLAVRNLGNLDMARTIAQTGEGFEPAISRAEQEGINSLTTWLKRKHVQSLLDLREGRGYAWQGRKFRQIDDAIQKARHYFGSEEAQATLEKGVDLAVFDFKEELEQWRYDLNRARNAYNHDTFRHSRGREGQSLYEKKSRLEGARKSSARRISDTASKAIELILRLPEEKRGELIQRLYDACDPPEKGKDGWRIEKSPHDAFSIAKILRDRDKMFKYGFWVMGNESSRYTYVHQGSLRDEVKGELSRLAWNGSSDEKFRYFKGISRAEAVKEVRELGMGELLLANWIEGVIKTEDDARKQGEISDPRMYYGGDSLLAIANLAENLGMKNVAREFYCGGRMFSKAAELTDDALDKATLTLKQVGERINERFDCSSTEGHSSRKDDVYGYGKKKMDAEVDLITGAIRTARNQKGSRDFYQNQIVEVARTLFEKAEYQEGALLLRRARLPARLRDSVLGESVLASAEEAQDFAGCYWLARVSGDEEQASKYQVLAKAMKQPIHSRLEDYKWREPRVRKEKVTPAADDDNLPF